MHTGTLVHFFKFVTWFLGLGLDPVRLKCSEKDRNKLCQIQNTGFCRLNRCKKRSFNYFLWRLLNVPRYRYRTIQEINRRYRTVPYPINLLILDRYDMVPAGVRKLFASNCHARYKYSTGTLCLQFPRLIGFVALRVMASLMWSILSLVVFRCRTIFLLRYPWIEEIPFGNEMLTYFN